MSRTALFIERGRDVHGERFDASRLAPTFFRWHDSGERVRVLLATGEERVGVVRPTAGWQPVFILARDSSSSGRMVPLGEADEVIAVKRGGEYLPPTGEEAP